MTRQKIVLAYSGGLDTSILVRILTDDYGYDVIACHADVGEAKDKEYLSMRARKAGAVACEVVDAQDEFARDFCFPALQANALYQGIYPLSAALSRPLIARPQNGLNRVQVSIAPPQVCVILMPSSCGNVSTR